MSRAHFDRLRAFASHLEDETPPTRAGQIASRAMMRAEQKLLGRLRAFAVRIEAGTRAAVAERIAIRAVAGGARRSPRYVLRRVGAVTAAAVTLWVGAVGVGAIANQASPGDLLYGVDRAYEAAGHVLGSNAPHTEERLTEALTLMDQGRGADAVALVDEAVKEYSVQNGLTDLEKAYAAARSTRIPVTSTTAPVVTPTTASRAAVPAGPPTTIVAAPEETDPIVALRLAAEMLLRNVQAADTDSGVATAAVTDSALQVAAAAAAVEEPVVVAVAPTTSTTSDLAAATTSTTAPNTITLPVDTPTTAVGETTTTSSVATTTLTMPDETTTLPGETTTTTAPDGTSTTTTTVPYGTSTTTTTAPDDGSGGIILPPQP